LPESIGWIINFHNGVHDPDALLTISGGKGANLARLTRAGLPVPEGFILTTLAYRDFVSANQLEERIQAALPPRDTIDPDQLEAASQVIRGMFAACTVPPDMEADLHFAYAALGAPPVAVRSSATTEDTLELSFAGQQDTFLNIVDDAGLRKAVIDCWSSLWTARAIGYRNHHQIAHTGLALAVVVQRLVPSDVSGVLFTANPLNGLRSEMVVDAAFGLGEALVSGQVEPDQYAIDRTNGRIIRKVLGAKAKALHAGESGGTVWQNTGDRPRQALPDADILKLADLGQKIEALYQFPQDIEWALAVDRLYILQSRPITTLFPTPAGLPAEPLKVMVSFAAIQGLMTPITPLGQDTMRWIAAVVSTLFGIRVTIETQTVVKSAGERLWMNITTPLRNSVGRRLVQGGLGIIEPSVRQAVMEILDDSRLQPGKPGISAHARGQVARFAIPVAWNILLNMAAPSQRRAAIVAEGEGLLLKLRARVNALPTRGRPRLADLIHLYYKLISLWLPGTFRRFVSGVAAGMASLNALNHLANQLPGADGLKDQQKNRDLVLEITRGLPHNPTTEMDFSLWEIAQKIRSDPALVKYYQSRTPLQLGMEWREKTMPAAAAEVLQSFLNTYGGRGLAEIDLGRSRWIEDPTPVFEAITGFLKIDDPAQSPDAVFQRGIASARAAVARLQDELRLTRGGWFKARLAGFFASRVRQILGIRESPKFFAVRLFNLIRQELLATSRELAAAGELDRADDIFYLTFRELEAFSASGDSPALREIIAARRRNYEIEMHRRQIPRLLLSDGRAFYEGIQAEAGTGAILGSPVSPGSVEGFVRVVIDPHHANLQPGEIMVCPGTDPSWTPLFLTAAGLIMETGGMMTHGAVVAREYGIPAVVGVDRATQRLQTGMHVQLDGSSGQIVIL